MPKIGWLALVLSIFFFASSSHALEINIISPQKTNNIVYDSSMLIKGNVTPGATLMLNNVTLEVDSDGNFKAALIIGRAKNFAQLKATLGSAEVVKEIKVLQLITFPDIEGEAGKKVEWARREIIYLCTMRELESLPDGNYYPDGFMTRAELATWLVKALNLPLKEVKADVCADVPKEHWRATFIKTAIDQGFFTTEGNFFYPDQPVNRAQVAEIVVKALGYAKKSSQFARFFDVESSGQSSSAINEAYVNKLIIGVSNKKLIFAPRRNMTRAEAAKLFSRLPVEKAKIKELFDFNVGYSRSSSSKVSTAPKFLWLQLDPGILKMMLSKTVTLKVAVDDPQGADDISYVKADLSRLGGPPNAAMYDDGTNGDEKANDNIYSLSFETNFQNVGTWTIWVTVFDKSGLSETQAVKLEVNE